MDNKDGATLGSPSETSIDSVSISINQWDVELPKNVAAGCSKLTPKIMCPYATLETIGFLKNLILLFPAQQIWSVLYYKPIKAISVYLQEQLWTKTKEIEFWNLVCLARELGCDLLEHILMRFVQDQCKVHANHFSAKDVFTSFPNVM